MHPNVASEDFEWTARYVGFSESWLGCYDMGHIPIRGDSKI